MARRIGDLAEEIAQKLQAEHVAEMEGQENLADEADVMHVEAKRSIFAKMEFSWRPSDQRALEQIRAAGDGAFKQLFEHAVNIVDNFYASVRKAKFDPETGVVETSGGRIVWETDEQGREIEDWGSLTGQDIETTLLDLTRLKLVLAPQLDELLLEAVFARHIADDVSAGGYAALYDGTVGDRNAHAKGVSQQHRYHAFFRYYLYRQADTFMREINNFARVLERIRYWRIDDGKTTPRSDRSGRPGD